LQKLRFVRWIGLGWMTYRAKMIDDFHGPLGQQRFEMPFSTEGFEINLVHLLQIIKRQDEELKSVEMTLAFGLPHLEGPILDYHKITFTKP
jgi:hypothetical protein